MPVGGGLMDEEDENKGLLNEETTNNSPTLYNVISGLYSVESKLFDRLSGHQTEEFLHITTSESTYESEDVGRVVRKDNELYLIKNDDSNITEEKIIDDSEFSTVKENIETLLTQI